MRLLIDDYLGHAPQVQLSRALASRGHDVLHLYSADSQLPKADLVRRSDDPPSFAIEGIALASAPASSFLGKRRHDGKFGRSVSERAIEFRPDVLVSCNNPLDAQRRIQSTCGRAGIRLVYWLQDFYAVDIDRMIEGWAGIMNIAVGSYYHWLERSLLQRSDAVVPIAEDFLGILAEDWDIPSRQCMVVRDWFPLDRVTPGDKSNAWSRRVGIADRKVALYTGALGPLEDPPLLLQVAEMLSDRPDVCIVVVSEGEGADHLAAEAKARGLRNLLVLPFQPYESYGDVLASADVLLAMVGDKAGILYVPSKTASFFCAGRPIVLSADWRSIATTSIRESKAGRVVPPGDAAAMREAILAYVDDRDLAQRTGAQARRYAEQTFEISGIANRFERLFERLHSGPARRR